LDRSVRPGRHAQGFEAAFSSLYRISTALTTGSANYPQWGLSWGYDRYGNRLNQTLTAGSGYSGSVTVDAITNRIVQTTGTTYAYDANGNMTSDNLNTIIYDAENHATSSGGSLGSGTYTYDGNGLRVEKVSGSTTTVYLFSGSKVIAEYDNGAAPSSPSKEYIYAGSQLVANIVSGTTTYFHQDHLSNRLLTDVNGNVVTQRGQFPFGEVWYETGTVTKWKFTSYERDAESGNDYAMARFYLSRVGRFGSPDPLNGAIDDPQSLNRYSYVLNDPCNLRDPFGLAPCTLKFGTMGQTLTPQAQQRIQDIFAAAGVDVAFTSSGKADFYVWQNTPLVPPPGAQVVFGTAETGFAIVNNAAIEFQVSKLYGISFESSGLALAAVGTVISHELGHLIIPCAHLPAGNPSSCGNVGLMRRGNDMGDGQFLDPRLMDPQKFQFTSAQATAIQNRCKQLRNQKPNPPRVRPSENDNGADLSGLLGSLDDFLNWLDSIPVGGGGESVTVIMGPPTMVDE
jgi:RHS repeat-associated protein